jgi:asparaginyl-tRNA synthetase
MIEPEIAFIDLKQLLLVIETFVKSITMDVIKNCSNEIAFFEKVKPEIKNRLNALVKLEFKKLEYRKAIELLKEAVTKGYKFDNSNIFFGMDLASEHERYICENIYNAPTFIFNYPKAIKAFYMKANDDGETVAACDLLVPGVGEIVGGSQREDDYGKLLKRCQEMKIDMSSIQ